jgi:hypothetical protein
MGESRSVWWFSADRRWHEGLPPRGWWQARDGRWHPPETREATPTNVPAQGRLIPATHHPGRLSAPGAHGRHMSRSGARRTWRLWPGMDRLGS